MRAELVDCNHRKIQVLKMKRGFEWSCHDCGDVMVKWDDFVLDTLIEDMPAIAEGEGFVFNIVEGENVLGLVDAQG